MSPISSKAAGPQCFLLLYFDFLTSGLNFECLVIIKLLYMVNSLRQHTVGL